MIIKRKIKKEITEHLSAREITLIAGARQIGKTTLLLEIQNEFLQQGEKVLFLNLDNDSHLPFFQSQEMLLQKIRLEIGEDGYVFMDEIQRLENAGLFLKGLYDRNLPYKMVVSGSGSLELKEKIHESLAGRKRIFEMMPVSFQEFANFRTGYKYETRLPLYFETEKQQTLLMLNEYLNYGGYPRIVTETRSSEKLKLMDEIFRSYVEKDLVYLLKIERPEVFQLLIRILASQTGNLVNYSQLASQTGLSVPTLKKYLWYAEKTFSISQITPWYSNTLKEITKSPVYYFHDMGLRNYSVNLMGNMELNQQYGFVFQNFVWLLLKDMLRWKNHTLHYWRTTDKAEVDFVISKHDSVLPVEVKYGIMDKPAVSRSFRSFIEKYNPPEAWLVNRNFEHEITINQTRVMFLPFYKLMAFST